MTNLCEEISTRICDREAVRRLIIYIELLEKWAPRHNLVRFKNRSELLERHVFEALQGLRLFGSSGSMADIGSGATSY